MNATPTTGWFLTPLARRLLAQERLILRDALGDLFGFYAVQVGAWGPEQLLAPARTQLRFSISPQGGLAGRDVRGQAAMLPLASDSVDGILLPHTLERVENPHQVLRECQRVLVPEGRLVILGFRPWSSWALRRRLSKHQFPVGTRRFLSEGRLRDWLELLDVEVEERRPYAFRPPIDRPGILRRLRSLERRGGRFLPFLAGAYMLIARKRVASMTPIQPRWRRQLEAVSAVSEPVARRDRC